MGLVLGLTKMQKIVLMISGSAVVLCSVILAYNLGKETEQLDNEWDQKCEQTWEDVQEEVDQGLTRDHEFWPGWHSAIVACGYSQNDIVWE